MNNFAKGVYFEKIACSLLTFRGLNIVGMRIKSRFGEIDVLAKKEKTFYIVEIKYRKSLEDAAYSVSENQFNRSLATFFDFTAKHSIIFEKYFYIVILFSKKKYKIINVDSFNGNYIS